MELCVWGARGSVPAPGEGMLRYGGNTSCVDVRLEDGARLILDAGTGIRELGASLVAGGPLREPVHILLTHLHLDHIMGLLFFAPFFDPAASVTVWGPPDRDGGNLRRRLARYLSAPLSPIEIRDLPAQVAFEDVPAGEWRLGSARVRADLVCHRGTTLGYRVEEGDRVLAYIPDHEPALGQDLDRSRGDWISGHGLAQGASVLLHDAQYTLPEYEGTRGWGHSALPDAVAFARRAEAERVLLFHHDPAHDDGALDAIAAEARELWQAGGGAAGAVELAVEGGSLQV